MLINKKVATAEEVTDLLLPFVGQDVRSPRAGVAGNMLQLIVSSLGHHWYRL